MHTFTFQQIADHIQAAIDQGREDLDVEGFTDLDDDETMTDKVEYYLSESRTTTDQELRDRGFDISLENKAITVVDRDAMTKAYTLIFEISYEYDATKDKAELPTSWWEDLSLGGDDDVDYNSSYLWTVFDIVDDMLPDDYKNHADPERHEREEYHRPQEELDAEHEAYMADFYAKNPEAKITEELRARVHKFLAQRYDRHWGLTLDDENFELYKTDGRECTIYRAPRSDTGPWVFKAEGRDDIVVKED